MAEDKITLQAIYTECNNHLRENDRKRDQLISFYLVPVGGLLALINSANNTSVHGLVIPASILLSLLGIILILNVTEHRLWHTRYSFTSRLLVRLSRVSESEAAYSKTEKQFREETYQHLHINPGVRFSAMSIFSKESKEWIAGFFSGAEFYTFLAALTISAIPIYFLSQTMLGYFFGWFVLSVYFFVMCLFSAQYLYDKHLTCPWAAWLLRGIEKNEELTYPTNLEQRAE